MQAKNNFCIYQILMLLILLTTVNGCNKDVVDPIIINKDLEPEVDIDGNVFHLVEIGTQTWMIENLKATHYLNGDSIPNVTNDWRDAYGAWCYYENDIANDSVYGKLYNWFSVNDSRGLAPSGWHVPSDAEWQTLITYLGGGSVAGSKMKSITGWNVPNGASTNSSCFTGLAGGYRIPNGLFYSIGDIGNWWSYNGQAGEIAAVILFNDNTVSLSYLFVKSDGLSVRCIKD